jgi:hypothetical protein
MEMIIEADKDWHDVKYSAECAFRDCFKCDDAGDGGCATVKRAP